MSQTLSPQQAADALADAGASGWLSSPNAISTRIETGGFTTGLSLVNAIGEAAEDANHHPDLTLRWGSVDVRLTSHDVGGVTERDVAMAATVGRLAADADLAPSDADIAVLEMALDTPQRSQILDFWREVLGMAQTDNPDDLVSASGDVPLLWFQESGEEEPRQRWHPDLWVAPHRVADLISAAEKVGGRVVSDEQAPSFWVLADAEGNRMCFCTHQER